MGSLFSSPSNNSQAPGVVSSSYGVNPRLIPFFPDEISLKILARIPRIHYLKLKLVSQKWRSAITRSELFQVRKELKTTEEWLYIIAQAEGKLSLYALDPLSGIWQRLPPLPGYVSREASMMAYALRMLNWMDSIGFVEVVTGLSGRRNENHIMDKTPFCGCATGAIDGYLYVLGGFSRTSETKCVWRYDPITNIWQEANSMTSARAFCKTSVLNGKLYAVGGVKWVRRDSTARYDRERGGVTPLSSAEVFDPNTGLWDPIPDMPFSTYHSLPVITADFLETTKTLATGMSSYKGKLCVPQSVYVYLCYGDMGGDRYDPEMNSWVTMPDGMGRFWPARKAGTKLSVVMNDEMYALDLDHSGSSNNSCIKIYNDLEDSWNVVIGKVPVYNVNDVESPYLFAALLGKLHVIVKDSNSEIAVLEADLEKSMSDSLSTSSPSTSTSSAIPEVETDVWRRIATKNFGSAEPVSCQVLDA